jgi:predicted ATPase
LDGRRSWPRLFLERAQAALPEFALTESTALAVAEVCRRLDGIPLAIELAAVRVRLLDVEQIAARLDDRFRLLVGGNRTASPRQQTLRAAVQWSYELLSDAERRRSITQPHSGMPISPVSSNGMPTRAAA